jgi:hypothetical protein
MSPGYYESSRLVATRMGYDVPGAGEARARVSRSTSTGGHHFPSFLFLPSSRLLWATLAQSSPLKAHRSSLCQCFAWLNAMQPADCSAAIESSSEPQRTLPWDSWQKGQA